MQRFRKFVVFVFDVWSIMFVDCGKTQDCELNLNGGSFDAELILLGDSGKIKTTHYVFKVTRERNLKVCEDRELCAGRDFGRKRSRQKSREPSRICIRIKGAVVKSKKKNAYLST